MSDTAPSDTDDEHRLPRVCLEAMAIEVGQGRHGGRNPFTFGLELILDGLEAASGISP